MALILLAGAAAGWDLGDAQASFAGAAGFSGQVGGQTCLSCHQPPHPLRNDAVAHLEGLPAAWSLGDNLTLRVSVTKGPEPLPAPAPQGGFDLAASAGRFEGDDALLRFVQEGAEATYRPAGVLQREWTLNWHAPSLAREPAPVQFWLAVLSANGNHVVATNRSDQGETLDSTASLHAVIPPADSVWEAWRALPLDPPTANLEDGILEGRHTDGNATRLLYSLDGGAWQARDTDYTWRLDLRALPDGPHEVALRSQGRQRESPAATFPFVLESGRAAFTPASARPAAAGGAALALLALCAALRSRSPP